MDSISFRKGRKAVTFTLPYSDLVPALTTDQYEDLKADIAKRGVIVPIIVNERGGVVDGQHRLRAAAELGFDAKAAIPFEVHGGLTPEGERELAMVLNLCRRHLGREQRREVVLTLKAAGLSNTQIALRVGVDEKTVRNDLRSISESSEIEQPVEVVRSHGKSYPSSLPTTEDLNARQERVQAAREESQSVRSIAKAEGVSVGTVAADLAKPMASEETPKVDPLKAAAMEPESVNPSAPAHPDAWEASWTRQFRAEIHKMYAGGGCPRVSQI